MMPSLEELGIFLLSKDERITLAREILDTVIAEQAPCRLTQAQIEEIDRRIEYSDAHPEDGRPWEDVKRDLLARLKK